jgi:hypothetical protein
MSTSTPIRPRHGLVVVAVIFVALVVGTGAIQLFTRTASTTTERSTVYTPVGQRFTVEGDADDLTIVPSADGQVHVRTVVRHGITQPELVEESTPSGVYLDASCDRLFDGFFDGDCDVAYTVELPPSFELVTAGNAGDVTVRGLTGPVRVDRSAGDVELIDVSGPVDVTLEGGEITAHGLRSDTVRAESMSGDVRLDLVEPPEAVRVATGSGEVDVTVPAETSYRVSASTNDGERSVTVPLDPASPRTITITGVSGDVWLHTP